MHYLVLVLPAEPSARTRRIAFEREVGGTLYTRPDGTTVLVRSSWPYPSSSLVSLAAIPGDWTELAG